MLSSLAVAKSRLPVQKVEVILSLRLGIPHAKGIRAHVATTIQPRFAAYSPCTSDYAHTTGEATTGRRVHHSEVAPVHPN